MLGSSAEKGPPVGKPGSTKITCSGNATGYASPAGRPEHRLTGVSAREDFPQPLSEDCAVIPGVSQACLSLRPPVEMHVLYHLVVHDYNAPGERCTGTPTLSCTDLTA